MKNQTFVSAILPALVAGSLALAQPESNKVREIVDKISSQQLKTHVEVLAGIHSRHVASATIREARNYIEDQFKRNGNLEVELDRFEQNVRRLGDQTLEMVNVVATLPGRSDPGRIYVVGGHYDSRASSGRDAENRAPGAVDDGSGTAAVLELARVLSQYRFDATIKFIAFTGEEQGLLGSRHWAQKAKQEGLQVDTMITNDIVGNSQGGGGHLSSTEMRVFSEGIASTETEPLQRLRVSIGGENDSPSRQLARYVKRTGEAYLPGFDIHLIYRRDRFGRGGDHIPFTEVGYPGVRISEMYENYRRQHQNVRTEDGVQYGDLPEFFDAEYSAKIVKVNAAVLATLADAPPPPANVGIAGAVRYDTILQWDPVTSSDLAG